MRAFIFLLCTTVFSFTSNDVISQNSKIKIDSDKILSVDDVFKIISDQTDYKFIYQSDLFKGFPKIKIEKGTIKTEKLLEKALSVGDFQFNLTSSSNIVISKLAKAQQQITITGTVTDINSFPLVGVLVTYGESDNQGFSKIATTTDFDGTYSLTFTPMQNKNQRIYTRIYGYKIAYKLVDGRTTIDFTLQEDINVLQEVTIVSTGYQTVPRERATGAFGSVEKSQLEKPATSIAERLVGVLAGVQTGINGGGIEVRGQTALETNREPLIVLDGFPVENGFETINPNDVESITVLKDAAAASIWGARAANGVIVIVTKKAKAGKLNVAISSFVRMAPKFDLDYSLNVASSAEEIDFMTEAFNTDIFSTNRFFNPSPGTVERGQSQAYIAFDQERRGIITQGEKFATINRLRGLDNRNQIKDHLLQTPITRQHNISISGGDETMSNGLSILYEDSQDAFKGNSYDKYLINFNNRTKLTKKLQFEFSGMFQLQDDTNNGVGPGTIGNLSRYDMLVNPDGSLADLSNRFFNYESINAALNLDNFPYQGNLSYNPITEINNRDRTSKNLTSRIQTGLTLDIIEGLSVSSKIQYEIVNSKSRNLYKENTFDVRSAIIRSSTQIYNGPMAVGLPTVNAPEGGILQRRDASINSYNWRNQVNFNRTFAEKHSISFIAGSELRSTLSKGTRNPDVFGYNDESLSSDAQTIPLDIFTLDGWAPFTRAGSPSGSPFSFGRGTGFSENIRKYFSYYGNLGYTYNDKYTVSGSYRTDASNIITDDVSIRYSPFWSVGLGWQAHKESFLSNVSWLDRLNVRATYGFNGNIVDNGASVKPTLALGGSPHPVTGEFSSFVGDLGNPLLRWEKTGTYNVGVDFSMFGRKLYGSVDVYNKKGEDLFVTQSIPAVNGTTTQTFNSGEMINKGFELVLGTVLPIKGNDIVWSGSINYSHNDNEITSLYIDNYSGGALLSGGSASYIQGYNANTLWSYIYTGVNDLGTGTLLPTIAGEEGENIALNSVFINANAENILEASGTNVAPTIVGMRQSFKVYDFNLSFIVTGKFGHKFRSTQFNYQSFAFGFNEQPIQAGAAEVLNADPSKIVPLPTAENPDTRLFRYGGVVPFLDYAIEDASHIRFQEINLSYGLPSNITSKLGINTLNIYAQINNVGTILFNDVDEDPEFRKGGPKPQTTLTFGMNLNF